MTVALGGSATLTPQSPLRGSTIAHWPWVLPVAAACLGWLSVLLFSRTNGHGHIHHLLVNSAMTVAMMSPLAVALCVAAARSSLWSASTQCVLAAFATFIGAWIAAGAVLHVLTELAIEVAPAGVVAVGLATWCAIDVASRRRTRRLSACFVSRPLFPNSSTLGAIDLGATAASRCLGTCWAPMALAVTQPALGVPVSALIVLERLITPRPRWSITAVFGLVAAWGLAATWR
jgi:predicted metal-binding membrane protein